MIVNDEISNLKEHLLYLDKTDDKHYIDKIIELYKDGIDEQTLKSIFWQRFEIEDWLTNKSLDGKDYTVLYKENEKGLFRSTTYKTDDVKQVWLRTIIYEDEDITINKPSSFGEAQLIGLNTWCFCKKESYWHQHHLSYSQDGNNETIYFIHNVMATYPKNYATDMVKENGKHEILDSLHHHIFPKEFFQQIGMDAANMLKPIITESKTHKNMKKNVIKMNEAQLRKLVKESINEINFDKNRRFATTTVTDPVGYHYTFRDAAANIVQNGFSPKYIGKNGQLLGPGIYFYTEPHVHDRYGDIEIKAKITGTYPATEWDGGTMFVVPIEDLDKIEIISAKQKYGYGPEHSVKDGKKEHEINQMYRQYGNRSVGGISGVDDADDYYDLNKNSGSLAMQAMEEPDNHVGSLYRDNGQNPRWASPKGDFSTKRISESQLRNMIAESVKKVLKEDYIGKDWFDENPNNGMFSENFEKVLNDSYKAASILLDACVKEISNVQDMNAKRELEMIREKTSNYLTNLHSYVPGTRTC